MSVRRVQLKCDGTQWCMGGEVKGKLVKGVGSQYPPHYLGTWCMQHYYRWLHAPWLPVVDWTDAPANLNGLIRFAKRQNLISVRVPSHFKHSLQIDFCTIFHIFISPVIWETSSFVIISHVFLAGQTRSTFNCINTTIRLLSTTVACEVLPNFARYLMLMCCSNNILLIFHWDENKLE